MGRSDRKRASRLAMGVAAAGVATTVAGVAATQPASISTPLVDLTALIAVGSSTNPSGAGVEDFFGGQFKAPKFTGPLGNDIATVNFLTGPWGINQALQANADDPNNAIVASGWGAANASLLLQQLSASNDPATQELLSRSIWVLDNNVSAPDGGFGTRYPWFALIGVNPFPTPTDTAAKVVITAYQYNYNSNAPADLFNGVAHLNSLVAYLYGYQDQQQVDLPVDDEGNPTCGSSTCTVMEGDRVVAYVVQKGNTTYVTYTTDQLPLARLIRDFVPFGVGDMIADRTEPLLKLIVDSAYYGGNPIPTDPSQYKPARLFPSPAEIAATLGKIPAALQQGFTPDTSDEAPETASTLADSTETTELSATEEVSEDTAETVKDLVRESDKAVPGEVGIDDVSADDPETPGTEQDSETEEQAEQTPAADDETETDTDGSDETAGDTSGDDGSQGGGQGGEDS